MSASARVSLGYLSEVERGQKEASSELLAAICAALGTPLSQIFREVSDNFALAELQSEPVLSGTRQPSLDRAGGTALDTPVARAFHGAVPASLNLAPGPELSDGAKLGEEQPVLDTIQLPAGRTATSTSPTGIRDITDMVPV